MNRVRGFLALTALMGLFVAAPAFPQGVGINDTGAAADTSALLDLASTAKGFLPPRMTAIQRAAIVLPATGLVVFQTDGSAGLYYNIGTPLAPSWKLIADAGSLSGGPWTVSGPDIYYSAGNVGIQRSAPTARLDVLGGNWDVVNGEGDVRIGDGTTRLKFGIATGGGGTGAATIMEQGPIGAYNVLALGTQGNKVLHVNGSTQRVGIGTDAPNAPLGFPAALGKKITLYPGATGDVGIGVASNRLQLYADNPNADVALGYDQAGVFNERFSVKPTGALAVNGNTGNSGQVLQSNGSGAAATWVSPTSVTYNNLYQATSTSTVTIAQAGAPALIPGLSQTVSVPTSQSRLLVSIVVPIEAVSCFACAGSQSVVAVYLDGVFQMNTFAIFVGNGQRQTLSATFMQDGVSSGNRTVTVEAFPPTGNDTAYGSAGASKGTLTVQVIPQ
jgi:hypothetical protein